MAKQEFSLTKIAARIPTEADAYLLLEELRWGGEPPACPKCGAVGNTYYIRPMDGTESRKTRTGSRSQGRVWRCRDCKKQFSVLTDTIFHGTKISIRTWLLVIFEVCASKNSVSAWEISRKYSITNESAWHMLHRIREAMKREPVAGLLSGTVIADETWIGGQDKNRHANKRTNTGTTDKAIIVSLVHYETREVRSRVVADVTAASLLPVIEDEVRMETTALHTDGHKAYATVAKGMAAHVTVDHSVGQYVSAMGIGTNPAEGFFSQLKRSVDGTHHHVSREHLSRYLAQFDYMYSRCRWTDSERMRDLLGRVEGRRLSYKPLTARQA
jgi:transposase-like protein